MTEKLNFGGLPATRKKYTPAFKAECVRQVAAGAWQSDMTRAQGLPSALLRRWQRQALGRRTRQRGARGSQAAVGRAQTRGNGARYLKKAVIIFSQPPQS